MESYLVLLVVLITTLAIIHIVQAQDQQGILFFLYTSFLLLLQAIFCLMNSFTNVLVLKSALVFMVNLLPCLLTLSRIH